MLTLGKFFLYENKLLIKTDKKQETLKLVI